MKSCADTCTKVVFKAVVKSSIPEKFLQTVRNEVLKNPGFIGMIYFETKKTEVAGTYWKNQDALRAWVHIVI